MATLMIADVIAKEGDHITTATVSDNTDLHRLTCSVHRKADWCHHMQNLVVTVADAKQIDAIEDATTVSVPLLPTKGVWAWVTIESMHHAGMHEVVLPFNSGHHLGVLAGGEGRNAIRLMLWEWLTHEYRTVGPCSSTLLHKRMVGKRFSPGWEKKAEPSHEDIADTFMVILTGHCLTCHPYTDFSADIPVI